MTGDADHVGTKCSPARAVIANPTDDRHTTIGTACLDCFSLALAHDVTSIELAERVRFELTTPVTVWRISGALT